jgi:hypothetical protein
MVSLIPKLTVAAGILAILYQGFFKNFIFTIIGVNRPVAPLSSFGMRCERVLEPGLEACEDMWLHDDSGLLYMACSSAQSKTRWNPSYVFFFFLWLFGSLDFYFVAQSEVLAH